MLLLMLTACIYAAEATGTEAYPSRQIEVIIPAPPGGSLDVGMRIVQQRLSPLMKVPLVIVNRPGASGALGMGTLARAAPDGYVLAATSTSTLTVVPVTASNLRYGLADFVPLGNYASDPGTIAVRADAPWQTLNELVDYAKANPGKMRYGSAGVGTLSMLNMQTVNVHYGLDIIHVPFSGAPEANFAVIGKQIEIAASPLSAVSPFLKDGSMRALLMTGDAPPPEFSHVPTMKQKGIRGASFGLILGLYAPAGIPDEVVKIVGSALHAAIEDPDVDAALQKVGMQVTYEDGATAKQQLQVQLSDVAELGRKLNLTK